jgi:gliding motility-associated-like protein
MRIVTILLLLLVPLLTRAQTCTTGLGDPIVDITFGAGPNFGPPLASGITNMTYVANGCPEDGYYTIANSTSGCFSGNWVNVTQDHTGNPNGYFMLINASYQPSVFYTQTVTGLCPSTQYQFAAWVLNMAAISGQILPDLTFTIEKTDGTILQSLQTGNIPAPLTVTWYQYAFYFTTPPGVSSVVIQIANNAPGGDGNDLALDDITFRTAGPQINVSMNGHAGDTLTLCPSASNAQAFTSTVQSCYASTAYQWQESTDNGATWGNVTGATGTTYTANPTTAGNYQYRLAAAQTGNIGISSCQVVSAPDSIVVLPISNPALSIATDSTYVCADSMASFNATPTDGGPTPMYQWTLNGNPVGSNSPAYSSTTLANGDQVSCTLTSDAACLAYPTAASNTISLNVVPHVVSALTIGVSANPICQDSPVTITGTPVNGGSTPGYEWWINGQPQNANGPTFTDSLLENGDVVTASLNSSLQCSDPVGSNAITMTVYAVPTVNLPQDTAIAPGASLTLNPTITGQIASYEWDPGNSLNNPTIADPVASPQYTTTYALTVLNVLGCSATAKELVVVFYGLHMPTAFTPNGDGHNDIFMVPPSLHVTITQFKVFNRWGQMVFSTSDAGQGWDGTLNGRDQPVGAYTWEVEYFDPLLKKYMAQKGTVTLMR